MVPVIVLAISVAAFGLIAGERFFSLFNLSLIMQQGDHHRHPGGGAEPESSWTAGMDLSVAAIMG